MMNETAAAEPKDVSYILGHPRRAKSAKAIHKALKVKEGQKYPYAKIARDIGMTIDSAHRIMKLLVAAGVVRRGEKRHPLEANTYYVLKDL